MVNGVFSSQEKALEAIKEHNPNISDDNISIDFFKLDDTGKMF